MGDEKQNEEDHELPRHNHFHIGWEIVDGHGDRRTYERHKHSQMQSSVKGVEVVTMPGIANFQNPGIKPPGIFFEPYISALPAAIAIDPIVADSKAPIDWFHDSESDIFTLFNACDGAMHDGFLDIRKLDELSKEEREVLDCDRLREVWQHTTSGCKTCAGIVRTLNSVRGMFVGDEEELASRNDAF
jgi:hypothetical protein